MQKDIGKEEERVGQEGGKGRDGGRGGMLILKGSIPAQKLEGGRSVVQWGGREGESAEAVNINCKVQKIWEEGELWGGREERECRMKKMK